MIRFCLVCGAPLPEKVLCRNCAQKLTFHKNQSNHCDSDECELGYRSMMKKARKVRNDTLKVWI